MQPLLALGEGTVQGMLQRDYKNRAQQKLTMYGSFISKAETIQRQLMLMLLLQTQEIETKHLLFYT